MARERGRADRPTDPGLSAAHGVAHELQVRQRAVSNIAIIIEGAGRFLKASGHASHAKAWVVVMMVLWGSESCMQMYVRRLHACVAPGRQVWPCGFNCEAAACNNGYLTWAASTLSLSRTEAFKEGCKPADAAAAGKCGTTP